MSLVPDYEDSSSGSDSEQDGRYNLVKSRSACTNSSPASHAVEDTSPEVKSVKLPMPGFLSNNTKPEDTAPITSSVFINPYIVAENEKKAILEKHVKMVNTVDNTIIINGKQICWNYRKGRCRFGHNCKYAHDSDLQKSREQLEADNRVQQTVLCQSQNVVHPNDAELSQIREESVLMNKQKRKRPGLTQGLVPGKKVMKAYKGQQKIE